MKLSFRPKAFLVWIVICILAGFLFSAVLNLNFWWGAGLAAISMFANSLLAEWEDRQPGGFLDPEGEEPKRRGPSAS